MNYNKSVLSFTLSATLLLLAISFYKEITGHPLPGFQSISLLSEVMKKPGVPANGSGGNEEGIAAQGGAIAVAQNPAAWQLPNIITAFHDTSAPALPRLMEKLQELREGRRRKVRIAWLGDSMIEGDLITQTLRKRLQSVFGGAGAGFVKMRSVDSRSRSTVTLRTEGDWKDEKFTGEHGLPLFLSGYTFYPQNGTTTIRDNTAAPDSPMLVKTLIYGQGTGSFQVFVNDTPRTFTALNRYNRLVLDSSGNPSIKVRLAASSLPVYGISTETPTGLVIDNFSFRGITGVELAGLDTALLQNMMAEAPYDLVVLHYGVNLLFRPTDTTYPWYGQKMSPVLAQLKRALPGADFLLISAGDRAFSYEGKWKTGIGVDSLVALQAQLAHTYGMAFYNLYQSMGGPGSIVKWADATPPLANKDYVHPNHKGAELLGNGIADAFLNDLRKWQQRPGAANATAGR